MKIRVTNVPLFTFADVTVEVEENTREAICEALCKLGGDQLHQGIDTSDTDVDTNALDNGWDLHTEIVGEGKRTAWSSNAALIDPNLPSQRRKD